MSDLFSIKYVSGMPLVAFVPWWERGIVHGMTLSTLDFSDGVLELSGLGLSEALCFSKLLLPRQKHGANVLCAEDAVSASMLDNSVVVRLPEADAVLSRGGAIPGRPYSIGVRTADCVPIIIEGADRDNRQRPVWVAVHAGWRGLAAGIIGETLKAMSVDSEPIQAAVFPCAGSEAYEVGEEVISAIGSSAVARGVGDGKYLLDLNATAANQLKTALSETAIHTSGMCTITASETLMSGTKLPCFHSFRRDGDRSGRSLTFLVMK